MPLTVLHQSPLCTVSRVEHHVNSDGFISINIELLAGDFILGTPVVDIRLANNWQVPANEKKLLRFPDWVKDAWYSKNTPVYFSVGAFMALTKIITSDAKVQVMLGLISSVLSQDPRSSHSLEKHTQGLFAVDVQDLTVVYKHQSTADECPQSPIVDVKRRRLSSEERMTPTENRNYIHVIRITAASKERAAKLNSKNWLDRIRSIFGSFS
jgi:hypothetical protein